MKPIAIFVLVAAISLAAVAANAKTATAPGNADQRMTAGVAGPISSAETAKKKEKAGAKKQAAPSGDQLRTGAATSHPHTTD